MTDDIEIRGGASEFEAALIAVVVDRLKQQERQANSAQHGDIGPGLPAWVRALPQLQPGASPPIVWPD